MLLKNNSPPQFFIENITVKGKGILYHPDKLISLSYKQNNLVMNLGAVNFTDAYLQRFSYRLVKNGNESWQETGFQRNIIFSNLAPGNYLLQIKVFSKSNTWPEQIKEISIIISPPFWQTAWFLIAACLLVAGIIYYLYHRRIKQVKKKAKQARRSVRYRKFEQREAFRLPAKNGRLQKKAARAAMTESPGQPISASGKRTFASIETAENGPDAKPKKKRKTSRPPNS
jgi:hypothetical protein